MPIAGKTGIFEAHPNRQTVQFAGRHICLSAIAREHCLDLSHLSNILSGKRNPSLVMATRLAEILDITLDEFHEALKNRKEALLLAPAPDSPIESLQVA